MSYQALQLMKPELKLGNPKRSSMTALHMACRHSVRQAKGMSALQVGTLLGKVEPGHPEQNPALQEDANVVKSGERSQQAVIRKGEGEWDPKYPTLFVGATHRVAL